MKEKYRNYFIKIGTVISIMYYVFLFYQPCRFLSKTGYGAAIRAWEFEEGITRGVDYKMQRTVVGILECTLIIPAILLAILWCRQGRKALSKIGFICVTYTLIATTILIFLLWKALHYETLETDAVFARIWIFYFEGI